MLNRSTIFLVLSLIAAQPLIILGSPFDTIGTAVSYTLIFFTLVLFVIGISFLMLDRE